MFIRKELAALVVVVVIAADPVTAAEAPAPEGADVVFHQMFGVAEVFDGATDATEDWAKK